MSAGCGSVGREQSDPAPLQSNITSLRAGRGAKLSAPVSRGHEMYCLRPERGEARQVVGLGDGGGGQRFVSRASLHSGCGLVQPLRDLHQIRLLTAGAQRSTRAALCSVTFVCLWLDPTRR